MTGLLIWAYEARMTVIILLWPGGFLNRKATDRIFLLLGSDGCLTSDHHARNTPS